MGMPRRTALGIVLGIVLGLGLANTAGCGDTSKAPDWYKQLDKAASNVETTVNKVLPPTTQAAPAVTSIASLFPGVGTIVASVFSASLVGLGWLSHVLALRRQLKNAWEGTGNSDNSANAPGGALPTSAETMRAVA